MYNIVEPFGPDYDVTGPGLATFRRKARKGLAALSRDERQAYGAAVEAAVLASQRAHLRRPDVAERPNCASGTYHTDGESISKAVRAQQRAAAVRDAARVRREREPKVWRAMYAEAMKAKRKQATEPAP